MFDSSGDQYPISLSDLCSGFRALKPPKRVSVSEGTAANLIVKQPGMSGGPWSAAETPYMVEPMNMLASRKHEAVVFAGPARTGKTAALLLGWMSHIVINDPGDLLMVQMTKDKARVFSKTDVDRAIRNSPNIQAMKSPRVTDANTFDTMFRNGVWMQITWPTISNVSGSTYRYGAITDLDRIENADNVDGEGPLFDHVRKRTTTFLSRGMVLAESSPGYEIEDPHWRGATPHEAPPVKGILGLYNGSDRRRWHWNCPECDDWFEAEPGLGLFHLPKDRELMDEVRTANINKMAAHYGARIICPKCGSILPAKLKSDMNARGLWMGEGQHIVNGRVEGDPLESTVAGYWLGGVAATYQRWVSLVERYLQGLRDYSLTGSEEKLKTTTNTDQGAPYLPRLLKEAAESAQQTADKPTDAAERYLVPAWTRLVVASVDVQGGMNARFVVQVHAVGENFEQALVNRFEIKDSRRVGMGTEWAPIDPAAHPEDWDRITDEVIKSTYRTPTDGKEIRVMLTVVDTGGEGNEHGGEGVAHNAYAWFRRLRQQNLASRVRLTKGASSKTAPLIKESLVGSRKIGEKGDVPLITFNPNLMKDAVHAGLRRQSPGPGFYHFPAPQHPVLNPNGWLPQAFFDEFNAEVRQPNGVWTKVKKRNESLDCSVMIRVGLLTLGYEKIKDWANAPIWAKPLDENREVITAVARREMKAAEPSPVVAPAPTPIVQQVGRARRSQSTYLR